MAVLEPPIARIEGATFGDKLRSWTVTEYNRMADAGVFGYNHDLMLIVEVSDTTLRFDRSIKRNMYAKAGIPEYWIIDVNQDILEVFRDPFSGSGYNSSAVYQRGSQLSPLFSPDTAIEVDVLLG